MADDEALCALVRAWAARCADSAPGFADPAAKHLQAVCSLTVDCLEKQRAHLEATWPGAAGDGAWWACPGCCSDRCLRLRDELRLLFLWRARLQESLPEKADAYLRPAREALAGALEAQLAAARAAGAKTP